MIPKKKPLYLPLCCVLSGHGINLSRLALFSINTSYSTIYCNLPVSFLMLET